MRRLLAAGATIAIFAAAGGCHHHDRYGRAPGGTYYGRGYGYDYYPAERHHGHHEGGRHEGEHHEGEHHEGHHD
jgi:hypothetical protein